MGFWRGHSLLLAVLAAMLAGCAAPPTTLAFRYPDGQVCEQRYDQDLDQVSCNCPGGFSNNYSKYTPNSRRTAVDAFCLSLAEYQELRR